MTNQKENFLDTLFRIGAYMGGAWLLVEAVKLLADKVYVCPGCGGDIPPKSTHCPHCRARITWKQ